MKNLDTSKNYFFFKGEIQEKITWKEIVDLLLFCIVGSSIMYIFVYIGLKLVVYLFTQTT